MSPSRTKDSSRAQLPSSPGVTRDVRWIRNDAPINTGVPLPRKDPVRAEQINAAIVMGLTLACTLLALYDLYLLASFS